VFDLLDVDLRLSQTVLNRLSRKTGAMLDAIKAFFLDRGDDTPIFDQASSGVAVICVNAKNIHLRISDCELRIADLEDK
jgi:hypothetical protein